MNVLLRRAWWMLALRGAAAIAFGALAFLWPGLTWIGLAALFIAYTLLGGALWVALAVRNRKASHDWWIPLVLGLTAIGAGMLALFHPAITVLVLILLIGANAMVGGVLELVMALRLRQTLRSEWMLVLHALASIAFGVLTFLFPTAGAYALIVMISAYAIATGVLLLGLALRLRSAMPGQAAFVERRVQPDRRVAPAH
ncbi:HdeD family acid-resistance protein [Oxalobacteraceae bacterium OM1]|nr:HdeD family acid-resistance protein [Oxalobacteraceae bacterium OM1]